MIREELVAERIAIESYSEIKEHAEDLKTLIQTLAQSEERMGREQKTTESGGPLRRAS